MIKYLFNYFTKRNEKSILVLYNHNMINNFIKRDKKNSWQIKNCIVSVEKMLDNNNAMRGKMKNDFNLLIDEFDFINKRDLNIILDNPWKTVTMLSSLK